MSATSREGLFAVSGSFIGLSTIAISARFLLCKRAGVPFGPDGWIALFGVITFIVAAACGIEQAVLGQFGYGVGVLTPEKIKANAKAGIQFAFAYDWFNLNTLACAKLSALFMYRRIFSIDRHGAFNIVIIATMVIVGLWYISSDALSLLQCPGHFSAAWDGHFMQYCTLNTVWANELAISDVILDFWILVLPMPLIMRLHTTWAKKLSIIGVFLLAFIGLGASIARIAIFQAAHAPGTATLWIGLLESGVTITVVNLPSIYFLYTSKGLDRVTRSLRSVRSLESLEGQDSPPDEGVKERSAKVTDAQDDAEVEQ